MSPNSYRPGGRTELDLARSGTHTHFRSVDTLDDTFIAIKMTIKFTAGAGHTNRCVLGAEFTMYATRTNTMHQQRPNQALSLVVRLLSPSLHLTLNSINIRRQKQDNIYCFSFTLKHRRNFNWSSNTPACVGGVERGWGGGSREGKKKEGFHGHFLFRVTRFFRRLIWVTHPRAESCCRQAPQAVMAEIRHALQSERLLS